MSNRMNKGKGPGAYGKKRLNRKRKGKHVEYRKGFRPGRDKLFPLLKK